MIQVPLQCLYETRWKYGTFAAANSHLFHWNTLMPTNDRIRFRGNYRHTPIAFRRPNMAGHHFVTRSKLKFLFPQSRVECDLI